MNFKIAISTIITPRAARGSKIKSPFRGAIFSPLGRFNLEPRSTAGVGLGIRIFYLYPGKKSEK